MPGPTTPALNPAVPDEPADARRVPIQGQEATGLGAVPDDDPALALVLLKAHYAARRRAPRVELVAECHPALPALLREHGFEEEARVPLLACTRASWREPPLPPGLRVEPLLPSSSRDLIRAYLVVQRDAYGIDATIAERAPPRHWQVLGIDAGLLATVEGEPAGAGGLASAVDGLREVRGLAVRPPFLGRGVATFLLAALAKVAHETGADAALATPEGPEAVELARRAGFVPVATLASYRSSTPA